MKLRLILPGVLLALALALASCAPAPQLRDPALLSDTGLIDGEPCEAPCWRGITPGETSWRDALTIVEDDVDFGDPTSREDENSDAIGAVWSVKDGPECCQMVAEDGETVSLIFVRTRPENTVGELIDVHGEPTYAVGTPVTEDQALINLVYPELRTIVLAFVAGENADVGAGSEIIGMLHASPTDIDLFMKTQYLHEWTGYGPFAEYRQAEDADYEVTPSVTLTPTPGQ